MSPRRLTVEEREARVRQRAAMVEQRRADRVLRRPHVAEWFGHRVFPEVADHPLALRDQREGRCPFLSRVAGEKVSCTKAENSQGVCTISAGSNGPRQDWLVCPHRALDESLLEPMIRRLFGMTPDEPFGVTPVTMLGDEDVLARVTSTVRSAEGRREFVSFQQRFGGEISLPRSHASPEFSFDLTIVELHPGPDDDPSVRLGAYGVIEIQTTDTHGSYRHAVHTLRNGLDLHADDFAAQLREHPEWPGRKVEGPNISNVFKRTFYQVMFKFQLTRRASAAGCVLALPRPVWESWLPFLGAPQLVPVVDGVFKLAVDDEEVSPAYGSSWIYVFDFVEGSPEDGQPAPLEIVSVIETDAPTLSRLALEAAPRNAIGDSSEPDSVTAAVGRRLSGYVPVTGQW